MAKPPLLEIKLDEFEQTVNGQVYHPHEGESVWLRPVDSIEKSMAATGLARFQLQIEAAKGDPDEAITVMESLAAMTQGMAEFLAPVTVKWNVTDYDGKPCPEPDATAATVLAIGRELVAWIFGRVTLIETAGERKNGSRPSPTTSSATASKRGRSSARSGGGRSRPKHS